MLSLIVFAVGVFVGVVATIGIEVGIVLVLINKLNRKNKKLEQKVAALDLDSTSASSFDLGLSKKGFVWVLEPDKVPRNWREKAPIEQTKKNNFLAVSPVKKYAKIEDRSLVLKESNGSHTSIQLEGCSVEAVSASNLPSRKWSKRYPIKLESKSSVIYKGNKALYIYLESNWEKECWCKALRLASSDYKHKRNQFFKLQHEFHNYLKSLKEGYPAFKKPADVTIDRESENKLDGSSSKVRIFLKKLAKKASKTGNEYKANWTPSLGREEQKTSERLYRITSSVKNGPVARGIKNTRGDNMILSSSSSQSGSQSHSSAVSDADSSEIYSVDEGTFCWNLLISRLFFDIKGNAEIKNSIKARLQRSLSSIRTPSYIGEVICTDLDVGNLPPYIHSMRVRPTDMNEPWAIEVDIEYSGGLVLEIETRLEIRELDLQKGIADANREANSLEDVSSDLIESIERYRKQLHLSEGTLVDAQEEKDEDNAKLGGSKGSKSPSPTSPYLSRWKSIVNSIAKQVSEVPLSLSLRVASLRGTLLIQIKPPPSDQIWYNFISMPDIEMNLDSSVGEHKIATGQIASFLVNRFKAAIRETLVLPNCESLCIPWMLADKNDWVPRKIAPFIWLNQEPASDPTAVHPACNPQPNESETRRDPQPNESETRREAGKDILNHETEKESEKLNFKSLQQLPGESAHAVVQLGSSSNKPSQSGSSLQELEEPLSGNKGSPETSQRQRIEYSDCQSPRRYISLSEKRSITVEDDEGKSKGIGRRARMFDLGKKVSEKLEEKRRHLEEKSRHIVEKMRGS